MFLTNRGRKLLFEKGFRNQWNGGAIPTSYYAALFTAANVPTEDTALKSELTEIANGNGYTTGGLALALNSTDFPTLTQDDTLDKAIMETKTLEWTATGGSLPASGGAARYVAITDDHATQGSRNVIMCFDLGADQTVTVGNVLRALTPQFRWRKACP